MIHITIYQYLGDFFHLASFFLLVYRLWKTKSAGGISLKTQELYFLVFCTRYIDIFHSHTLYLFFMKALYLSVAGGIVYVLRYKEPWKSSYVTATAPADKFPHLLYAVAPCAAIALFVNEGTLFGTTDGLFSALPTYLGHVLWAFSIFLEAVAIIPQLIVLHAEKVVENVTSHYVATLGVYRALYIVNWIYKYNMYGTTHWIAWIAGVVQTAFFLDFFYYYFRSKFAGMKHVPLPT